MEDFCSSHIARLLDKGGYVDSLIRQHLPASSEEFLMKLDLPLLHPLCVGRSHYHGINDYEKDIFAAIQFPMLMDIDDHSNKNSTITSPLIPPSHWLSSLIFPRESTARETMTTTVLAPDMGPPPHLIDQTLYEKIVTTFWYYIYPSFSLARIWFIFFAGFVAPAILIGSLVMMFKTRSVIRCSTEKEMYSTILKFIITSFTTTTETNRDDCGGGGKPGARIAGAMISSSSSSSSCSSSESASASMPWMPSMLNKSPVLATLGLVSSWIVLTDDGYVLEFGRWNGIILIFTTILMIQPKRTKHFFCIFLVICMSHVFISPWYCEDSQQFAPDPGLYYNPNIVGDLVESWKKTLIDYSSASTPWLFTGDARTGIPYAMNYVDRIPTFHRVWLPTVDDEYVGLDISFPDDGHDWNKPLYLVLSGLNGQSGYVLDFTRSRNRQGSTVVVLVARGLDGTPIQGFTLSHGVRTSDAHSAAVALRQRVKQPDQILAGVGYSLGAIVLSHYVSSASDDVALDVSVSISGALACKYQKDFVRSKRVWQPVIVANSKNLFLWSKWGHRIYHQLGRTNYQKLLRARDVVESDQYAGAMYNGFQDLVDFYDAMSSILDDNDDKSTTHLQDDKRRLHFSIPHLVLHALDDPISTFRTNASNDPNSKLFLPKLVDRHDNLVVFLTEKGGHIGWPVGWYPHSWVYMNDIVAANFILAYEETKRREGERGL